MANYTNYYYYAAAATIAIAGILHLVLSSNIIARSRTTGTFFLVAGIYNSKTRTAEVTQVRLQWKNK